MKFIYAFLSVCLILSTFNCHHRRDIVKLGDDFCGDFGKSNIDSCLIITLSTKYLSEFKGRVEILNGYDTTFLDKRPVICVKNPNKSIQIEVEVTASGEFEIPLNEGTYCYTVSFEGGFQTYMGILMIVPATSAKSKVVVFPLIPC